MKELKNELKIFRLLGCPVCLGEHLKNVLGNVLENMHKYKITGIQSYETKFMEKHLKHSKGSMFPGLLNVVYRKKITMGIKFKRIQGIKPLKHI